MDWHPILYNFHLFSIRCFFFSSLFWWSVKTGWQNDSNTCVGVDCVHVFLALGLALHKSEFDLKSLIL